MIKLTFLDYIWIYGIVIVNVLFYARKFIIIKYGGKVSFIGGYRDGKRLREATKGKISKSQQRNYKILNIAIPTIFLFSLSLFLILQVIPAIITDNF